MYTSFKTHFPESTTSSLALGLVPIFVTVYQSPTMHILAGTSCINANTLVSWYTVVSNTTLYLDATDTGGTRHRFIIASHKDIGEATPVILAKLIGQLYREGGLPRLLDLNNLISQIIKR